ncbi:hypothetical protein L6452_29204 [Arctium lappa]|uniref:Uncharacterized protein n=1 Tax=Arctium lappa TaxID=4217 RepID=A0ACB8ZHF3_ARCLA|nr:hypothetical protein L6452_29204 [Arctium lappa]
MDTNGMFSNTSSGSGMLGLEMSLTHHHQQQHPPQNPNFLHHQPPFSAAAKQPYPYAPKQRTSPISDEEDPQSNNINNPSTTEDSGGGGGDGKLRKGSPWQRMKWTDNMVRLLIMVVFYIGDESASDQPTSDTAEKKKTAAAAGGGVLQKKGKWKSVSRAMMERGFYVSPQQCEDKFNDLNKRYKRVNDILGKGTACKVVENQTLLESMDLPVKMKEEAKKLLNSKHLFFREMCAYHNSCGGGGGAGGAGAAVGGGAAHHSSPPEITTGRQNCVHSNDNDEEEDEDDGDEDDDVDDVRDGDGGRYHPDEEEDEGLSCRKRGRSGENDGNEGVIQQFRGEIRGVIQDLTKSVWEKRQWMKGKMMQLEEQRVGFQGQSYELEKQRLKWVKFSCKKEREMDMEKLRNERLKLENERMVLLLRQKDMELVDLQQQFSSSNAHI